MKRYNSRSSIFYLTSIVCLLFLLQSCIQEAELPYTNYYYPWLHTQDTVIYVYKEQSSHLGMQYHVMTRVETDSGDYVVKKVYDEALIPILKTREKALSNGFLLEDYILYRTDSTGSIDTVPLQVVEGQSFYLGKMKPGETLVEHYRINNIDTATHDVIIIKNAEQAETGRFMLNGKEYPSLRIDIIGEIEDIQLGSVTLPIQGSKTYVEGVGCVNFTQTIQNAISYDYLFQEELTVDEWKKLYNEKK